MQNLGPMILDPGFWVQESRAWIYIVCLSVSIRWPFDNTNVGDLEEMIERFLERAWLTQDLLLPLLVLILSSSSPSSSPPLLLSSSRILFALLSCHLL